MALNILIYCDDHGTGGAAAATHRLALGLADRGHRVSYAQSGTDSPRIAERTARGIGHVPIPYDTIRYYWPGVTDTRTPTAIILETRPDLIVFSDAMVESSLGAKEAAALLGVPHVMIKHLVIVDGLYAHDAAVGERVGRVFAAAAAVITVSGQNRRILTDRYPEHADRVVTIHNAVPDHFLTPSPPSHSPSPSPPPSGRREAFRRRFDIPDDAIVVLTAAALVSRKGFHHQARLLVRLRDAGVLDRFVFVWAGEEDAQYMPPLWRAIEASGCAGRVRRIGYQEDVAWCLEGSDVALLPSEQEALGLINLEAMAKGVPVLASAVGGIPEAVGEGPEAGGVLFPDPTRDPAGAVEGMFRGLMAWADDPAERARVGAAGRRRVAALFSNRAILDQYEAVFRRSVFEAGDWISPGLRELATGWALPHAVPAGKAKRPVEVGRTVHPRYVDDRFPRMPLFPATRDEAAIVHTAACARPGLRALEVGLSFGWIAWHMLAAGASVDVADPFLGHPEVRMATIDIKVADVTRRMRLIAGGPEVLPMAVGSDAERWGLIFVDGTREGLDVMAAVATCARLAAPDAMILIQGAGAGEPARALADLKAAGWRTRSYHTQGGLAAAWRGAVSPPDHRPDPALPPPVRV